MTFEPAHRERLAAGLASLGACAPADLDRATDTLLHYAGLIAETNQRFNLTADAAPDVLIERHLLDAAAGYAFLKRRGLVHGAAIDVGSGAGLPGVVWAALGGFDRVVCCEATGKKADFIALAARDLGLDRVSIDKRRAEDLGRDPGARERYDVATARALAPLNVLLELLAPFVRVGGVCLSFSGRSVNRVMLAADGAATTLGVSLITRERYEIPAADAASGLPHGGELLLYSKDAPTPDRYPRSYGAIRKRPL